MLLYQRFYKLLILKNRFFLKKHKNTIDFINIHIYNKDIKLNV